MLVLLELPEIEAGGQVAELFQMMEFVNVMVFEEAYIPPPLKAAEFWLMVTLVNVIVLELAYIPAP